MMTATDNHLAHAPDAISRVRLLDATCKKSDAWLNTLPISLLGLRMDDNTMQVAVRLHLGSMICLPHVCCHCGHDMNSLSLYRLSCKRSEGHQFHHALNDIIHHALISAYIPSRLEPVGATYTDSK